MIPSEEFIRHAAECESMAKFARDPDNKKVWRRMAERWIRCAELAQKRDPFLQEIPESESMAAFAGLNNIARQC